MAMAALAMTPTRRPDVTRPKDYQGMGIKKLRQRARESHEQHDPEAARVFVARILDMEAERRTLYGDEHLQGIVGSAIAPGHAPGGTDIAREPLAALYDRGIRYHEGHEEARRWIEAARLPPRQLLAVLIQARKLRPRQLGRGNEWTKSYDQIAAVGHYYAQRLGWPAEAGRALFKDGKAITNAATQARAELILQAKAGVLGRT